MLDAPLEIHDFYWFDVIGNNWDGTTNAVRSLQKRSGGATAMILLCFMPGGIGQAASYSLAQWMLLGLMKSVMKLGRRHITVNALITGLVNTLTLLITSASASMAETAVRSQPADPRQAFDGRTPLLRLKIGWPQPIFRL
jgi:NAD(P)-dependent dehydrogenase (short-subunit alcohol dehydrogenase family)